MYYARVPRTSTYHDCNRGFRMVLFLDSIAMHICKRELPKIPTLLAGLLMSTGLARIIRKMHGWKNKDTGYYIERTAF